MQSSTVSQYDMDGGGYAVITDISGTDATGIVEKRTVLHYDSLGRQDISIAYDKDRTTVLRKTINEFLADGKKKSTRTEDTNGTLLSKTEYIYDEAGRDWDNISTNFMSGVDEANDNWARANGFDPHANDINLRNLLRNTGMPQIQPADSE